MEEVAFESIYEETTRKKQRLIFSLSAMISNLIGTIANFILFGPTNISYVCAVFSVISVINLLVINANRNMKIPFQIFIFTVFAIEIPTLFFAYTVSALPYMVLGFVAIVLTFDGKTRYSMIAALFVIYLVSIILTIVFPEYSRHISEISGVNVLLLSGIVSFVISSVSFIFILEVMRRDNEIRDKEYAEMDKKMLKLSHYDSIAPCYNRQYLLDYLMLNSTNLGGGITLMLFDLIDLGYINIKYGYLYGDELLSNFASMAQDVLKGRGIVGRYDGQKFLVILNATAVEEVERVIRELTEKFESFLKQTVVEKIYLAYGYTICKSGFTVNDEIKILYVKARHYASSLPKRKWMSEFVEKNNEEV